MSELLTPRQAAEQMGISVSTIYQRLNKGRLEGAYKDESGRWQIPDSAIPGSDTQETPPAEAAPSATDSSEKQAAEEPIVEVTGTEQPPVDEISPEERYAQRERHREAALEELYAQEEQTQETSLEELYAEELDEDDALDDLYTQGAINREAELERLYAEEELDEEEALDDLDAREDQAQDADIEEFYAQSERDREADLDGMYAQEIQGMQATAEETDGQDSPVPETEDDGLSDTDELIIAAGAHAATGFDHSIEPDDFVMDFAPAGSEPDSIELDSIEPGEDERRPDTGTEISAPEENRRKRSRTILAVAGVVVVILAILAGLAYFIADEPATADLPTAETQPSVATPATATTLAFAPRAEDEALIVIPAFHSTEGGRAFHKQLQQAIAAKASEFGLDNLRVEIEPTVVNAEQLDEAKDLAERYQADMVIWGEDAGDEITVDILSLTDFSLPGSEASVTNSVPDHTDLANPSAHVQFKIGGPSSQLAFLSLFAVAHPYFLEGDYTKTAAVLKEALNSLDPDANPPQGVAEAYFRLGWLHQIQRSERQKVLEYYEQALRLEPNDAATLNNTGIVYDNLGDKLQALGYYEQALPIIQEMDDKMWEATVLMNIGNLHQSMGDARQALGHYTEALSLFQETGDKVNEAIALGSIGDIYSDLGEKETALTFYDQALALVREEGDRIGEAITLWNIGLAYDTLGDKQQALTFYNQALPLLRETGNTTGETLVLSSIGSIYNRMGDQQQALSYYNRVLPQTMEAGDQSNEAVTRFIMAMIYKDLGELEKAEEQMIKVVALDEAIGHPDLESDLRTLEEIRALLSGEEPAPAIRHR